MDVMQLGLAIKNDAIDPHDTSKNRIEIEIYIGIASGFLGDMRQIQVRKILNKTLTIEIIMKSLIMRAMLTCNCFLLSWKQICIVYTEFNWIMEGFFFLNKIIL